MTQPKSFDVAIIGAGIAGASAAYRLAAQRTVVVLERETQPGYHSTGRSAAMFMESYGPPAVRALTRASRHFYTHLASDFSTQPILTPRGAMYVANRGQTHLLDAQHAELGATCPGLERLDVRQTVDRVPCLRPELLSGSLVDPGAMDIDVHMLHQGFLSGVRRDGGQIRTQAEVASARWDGQAWQLQLADGAALSARVVINAAGAWADGVGRIFGARAIGLVPHRRSAFTFKPPDGVDVGRWPVVSGMDEGWYFKPDAGVLLGSPANADPTLPHDVVPEELDIATGIHHIEAATTLTIRRPLRTWAGLRSFVADGELVIGWDGEQENFLWLAAQGGYGIQSAPAASELAAALVLGRALPDELARHGVQPAAVDPRRLR